VGVANIPEILIDSTIEANLLPTEYENMENAVRFSTCVPSNLHLLLLVSCLASSSVLKVKVILYSKTMCSHGTRRCCDSEVVTPKGP
jgi:hypothetical protein